jgi:hypothetical protein
MISGSTFTDPHDAVIGNFENGSVGIFVDRYG